MLNATNEARRFAAVADEGPANDLALRVASTIDIIRENERGDDVVEMTVEVTGVVTFCADETSVTVDQCDELSHGELLEAKDALYEVAESMTEAVLS